MGAPGPALRVGLSGLARPVTCGDHGWEVCACSSHFSSYQLIYYLYTKSPGMRWHLIAFVRKQSMIMKEESSQGLRVGRADMCHGKRGSLYGGRVSTDQKHVCHRRVGSHCDEGSL